MEELEKREENRVSGAESTGLGTGKFSMIISLRIQQEPGRM